MFGGNETTIFLNIEVTSSGVDDSHTGFKGRRNLPKWPFGSLSCYKEPSQKGFHDGYEITSRFIVFGSPVVNSYAQSSNITSEQENPITTSILP
jgi:hypothetical protein